MPETRPISDTNAKPQGFWTKDLTVQNASKAKGKEVDGEENTLYKGF